MLNLLIDLQDDTKYVGADWYGNGDSPDYGTPHRGRVYSMGNGVPKYSHVGSPGGVGAGTDAGDIMVDVSLRFLVIYHAARARRIS